MNARSLPILVLVLLVALTPPGLCQAPLSGMSKDAVDRSVERGLAFLQSMQESDGSWRVGPEKSPAVTSLAIMAFLSAGHVPGEGPHGASVDKGIRWVLAAQRESGLIAPVDGHEMYHHGISTLMLAEVAGMTDAKLAVELKSCLEKAVAIILKAQKTEPNQHRGGWRYFVHSPDADVSVTGWQLLALRAAKNLGCDVPSERITLALDYISRCRDPLTGGYCYRPGGRVTLPCTGTCILALELCAKERGREALQAGSYLLKHPLTWGGEYFFYSLYYRSQAMFQLGSNYWSVFRPQLHKVLLDNQRPNGSWLGGEAAGANYGTAMSVLALTAEYRLLPIYQRGEDE